MQEVLLLTLHDTDLLKGVFLLISQSLLVAQQQQYFIKSAEKKDTNPSSLHTFED
jgi:hypothetical protein